MMEWLIDLDQDIFLALNGVHSSFMDEFMWWVSYKYTWIPVYLILLLFLLRRHGWRITLTIAVGIGLVVLFADQFTSGFSKPFFARPRPCHADELMGLVHTVNDKCGGPYGFVSSHSANFFALATFISPFFPRYFRWGAFGVAALVAYSRIYLGVHYPGDVIFGALVGVLGGFLIYLVFKKVVIPKLGLSTSRL